MSDAQQSITSVVFDVGETLLDDTREVGNWADWLGVPRNTFSAVLGALTATGRTYNDTFRVFRPGIDIAAEHRRRREAGKGQRLIDSDLYPDVRPALSELKEMGIWVGIAGNQPAHVATQLRELDVPMDFVATSSDWGVEKPAAEFFARVIAEAPGDADQILYVGDHRDHDVLPAHAAGMRTALIRRGPWGWLWADDPVVVRTADWVLNSLTELPALLRSRATDAPENASQARV